jgi:hypothetical protein
MGRDRFRSGGVDRLSCQTDGSGRRHDPTMAVLTVHGLRRAGELGIGEAADSDANDLGIRDGYQKTVEPHAPQKWNVTANPLSESR